MLKRGDTVRLSADAIAHGITPRDRTGVVISCNKYVTVRWNGLKSPYRYHPDFIERVPDDEPLPPEIAARFVHVEITSDAALSEATRDRSDRCPTA
jgi:hypothetical protein